MLRTLMLRRLVKLCVGLICFLGSSGLRAQTRSVSIQPEVQYQRFDGFGVTIGAGSAKEIMALPESERAKLLDLVFGSDGARVTIVRSEVSWSGQRLEMTHPLYLRGFIYYFADDESETAQFDLFREARKRGDVSWSSCVWSPPIRWKTNQSVNGGELLPEHYEDFSVYLAAYIEFYKKLRFHDIPVLSLQNSPSISGSGPGCAWTPKALRGLLRAVGKKFAEKRIPTKIMLPETSWEDLATFVEPILSDSEAKTYLSHISAHSPSEDHAGRVATNELCKRNNFHLWQTEYLPTAKGLAKGISGGLELAEQTLKDLTVAEVNAWFYGAVFPRPGPDNEPGFLQRSDGSFHATKQFFSFSQFSRFIQPDCVRISAKGGGGPLVAFRNPEYNGIIVVFLNTEQQSRNEVVELKGWNLERIRAFRTSADENVAIVPMPPKSGRTVTVALAPQSITTLVAQIRRVD